MTQDGRWIYARDLQVDDVVRSHSFGTQKISTLEISLTQTMVYNFLTDDLHNYAVGQNGILVHNTNTKFDDIPERISKGRVTPKNEAERVAWEEIHKDPRLGREMRILLKYPYFSTGAWRKMEYKKGNIVIHYVVEIFSGVVKDFKFKNK
ncbi:MAG: HINT domain-containing protein [Planctomycetaceae bacterium]|jgi:hypothetical protein|nr:HINT domain-containing protein [Planctomycetaceae bacterium]